MPTVQSADALAADRKLVAFIGEFYADPLGFVLAAYPWGEPGTSLAQHHGPDRWQRELLEEIGRQVRARAFDGHTPVLPIRVAVSSGHGVGKTTCAAWIVHWIMATRHACRGTLTANTLGQLQTKTWAAVQYWNKVSILAHWFSISGSRIARAGFDANWFAAAQSCREENSEAFAGQHAASSTSFFLFDESSAIPDEIYNVAEGGLTDGEPMIFLFGNATRSSGKFHRVCFGSERDRWTVRIIDSRTAAHTNKAQLDEWVKDYGEDSDFVRVRVRGLAPAASDLQFIDSGTVRQAQTREIALLGDEPLVCGLDVARGGSDRSVFRFRRGTDARSIPPIIIPGEETRDSMRLVTKAADVLGTSYGGQQVAMLFVDGTGIGGPIADRLKQLGLRQVMDIQFGSAAPDAKYANMRAWMWSQLREWLRHGAIDASTRLEQDLTAPGYSHDLRDRLLLESKEKMKARGIDSPDEADSLCLTFAAPVRVAAPEKRETVLEYEVGGGSLGWMGG